ncbi:hypothetical protein PPACK8108_LOCUS15870 [Phakopsora pachyrhizi]|uniref:Uncharacterized protein n=1 Tax=Phakopsora pachyrhizi TaxID=170000 RepID=A0AAV0B8E4_PHAPC|nr:hypothetical protein PPACK8108_LOCUS15870 [Phakopsora pachyrhizi]
MCAAIMMRKDVQEVLTKEVCLHQLDIRDEGHGIFQAGLRFTLIHHWNSWFQFQPQAHPHTLKDPSALASLLGSAAQAVGPENWTRHYVWGISEKGGKIKHFPNKPTVVLSLGFSITVHGSGLLKPKDLDKIKMTFAMNKSTSAIRPALIETKQRRTYFLYNLKTGFSKPNNLNQYPDVVVMSHTNQEGDIIDWVWDGRPQTSNKKKDESSLEDSTKIISR